jgi:hypothetical protein
MTALRSIRAKLDEIAVFGARWKRQARPRAYPTIENAGIELEFGQ